jgi:hypothetical protein
MQLITTQKVFDNTVFTSGAGLIKDSPPIDLRELAKEYAFSLSHNLAGTGTVKLECLVCSTKTGNYFEACADIVAAAAVNTPSAIAFSPILAPFMKIRATASAETVTGLEVWLNFR